MATKAKHAFRCGGFTVVEALVVIAIIALVASLMLPALSRARQSAQTMSCASGMRQWGVALRLYLNDHQQMLPRETGAGNNAASRNTTPDTWFNELPRYANAQPYGSIYDGANLNATEGFPNDWIWYCPQRVADKKNTSSGLNAFHYGMNAVLNGSSAFPPDHTPTQKHTNALRINNPARTIFITESNDQPAVSPSMSFHPIWPDPINRTRHDGGANLLFIDGRVEYLTATDVPVPTFIANHWRSDEPNLIWGPFEN